MAQRFDSLSQFNEHGFDTVIDVRSPAEFALDHVPGAINLPVLDDVERAEVGTIYVRQSAFKARKVGAALVARNAARHLQGPLADKDGGWKPLVYCWRGGQRSGSFASILAQVGWRADLIEGGYRSYRRIVSAVMHDNPLPHSLILLDGNTGTAKTEILANLQRRDVQTIDLEALAAHRGSVFGAVSTPQPSQKAFEGALANAFERCDPTRPVLLEAESSKIGRCQIPPTLWAAMCAAPRIRISAPLAARADYLVRAYDDLIRDSATLKATLEKLTRLQGREVVGRWQGMVDAKQLVELAGDLMNSHYDPRYTKSRSRIDAVLLGEIHSDRLDPDALNDIVGRIRKLVLA